MIKPFFLTQTRPERESHWRPRHGVAAERARCLRGLSVDAGVAIPTVHRRIFPPKRRQYVTPGGNKDALSGRAGRREAGPHLGDGTHRYSSKDGHFCSKK